MADDLMGKPGTIELPEHEIEGFEGFGHVTLEGAPNTRDLGGMPVQDGRMIRPHLLVRSGMLHDLTSEDGRLLTSWHEVKRVVDFRTGMERNDKPDNEAVLPGVDFYAMPVLSPAEVMGAEDGQKLGKLDQLKAMREYLERPYESMEAMYSEAAMGDHGMTAYRSFLDLLLEAPDGATLWHCTEGKDRAGMGAALVEHVLGVSRENILRDYLATNLFVQTWAERMLGHLARHKLLVKMDADVSALFYAYREFLGGVVQLIEAEYGSIDRYVADGLGFDADKQEALRERYLVDPAAYGSEMLQRDII